jgi:hypothetical protein
MPEIIEIYIANPIFQSGHTYFKVGIKGVAKIIVDCIDSPLVTIVFEDGSRECFCGMPYTYRTKKSPEEVPF